MYNPCIIKSLVENVIKWYCHDYYVQYIRWESPTCNYDCSKVSIGSEHRRSRRSRCFPHTLLGCCSAAAILLAAPTSVVVAVSSSAAAPTASSLHCCVGKTKPTLRPPPAGRVLPAVFGPNPPSCCGGAGSCSSARSGVPGSTCAPPAGGGAAAGQPEVSSFFPFSPFDSGPEMQPWAA